MLVTVLPGQLGHDVISMSSHAEDISAEVT
jgi:hypothetical protein